MNLLNLMLISCFFVLNMVSSIQANQGGLNWLANQAQSDGSYATSQDLSTPFQASVETIRAYESHNQTAQNNGMTYLNKQAGQNASYQAKLLITQAEQGLNTTTAMRTLLAMQRNQGGFGHQEQFIEIIFDTASVIEGFALAGQTADIQQSIQFLLDQQKSDGGWAHYGDNTSSIPLTAIVMRALWYHREQIPMTTTLNNAGNYLLNQKNRAHLWSEPYVSALALIALTGQVSDTVILQPSADALKAQQASDGSWLQDVYTTALCVRAIRLFNLRTGNVPPDLRSGVVTGKIQLFGTQEPISGANVALVGFPGVTTVSQADGIFRLAGIPPKNYTLSIQPLQQEGVGKAITVTPAILLDVGIIIVGQPNQLTLLGTVIDGVTGAAIADTNVTLSQTNEQQSSDTAGKFSFNDLDTLTLTLTFQATGYLSQEYTLTPTGWGEYQQQFRLSPKGDGGTTTTLSGTVARSDTGETIAGAIVTIPGTTYTTVTDNLGQYRIEQIDTLNLDIHTELLGYQPKTQNLTITEHGQYTLNIILNPINADAFQILLVEAQANSYTGNSEARFTARIANVMNSKQEVILTAEIQNSEGDKVAQTIPYAPGTTIRQAAFSFNGDEIKTIEIPWETRQNPVATYRIVVRVIFPETIQQSNPIGEVLAEASAFVDITEHQQILGALAITPPITQAGSNSPVTITAEITNKGNITLIAPQYQLTITHPDTQTILHQQSITDSDLEIGSNATLTYPEWIPTESGNLEVKITHQDNQVSGEITGILYVGNKATSQWVIHPEIVPDGDQTVQSHIHLEGVDVTTGTSIDPLFTLVKEAVRTGGIYVAREGVDWHKRSHCLGCHIQTQSSLGLSRSLDKADIDRAATNFLYHSIATSQQRNGTLRLSNQGDSAIQTALGLWALNSWPDPEQSFTTRYRAIDYLYGKRRNSANLTYWDTDHSAGWWRSRASMTSLVIQGFTGVIETAQQHTLSQAKQYQYVEQYTVDTVYSNARDIKLGSDNLAYILYQNGRVNTLDLATGDTQEVITSLSGTFYSLEIADDRTLYIGGNNVIYQKRLNQPPEILKSGGMERIYGLALGPDNNLYVSAYYNDTLYRLDLSGNLQVIHESGVINGPLGLIFNEKGNLLICNNYNYNIMELNPDTGEMTVFVGGLARRPGRIIANPESGGWYLSSWNHNSYDNISQISSTGITEHLVSIPFTIGMIHAEGQLWGMTYKSPKLYRLDASPLNTDQIQNYQQAVEGGVRYLLAHYQNTADDLQRSAYLQGIGTAKRIITDPALRAEIETAMYNLSDALRQRQRSDGSWSNNSLITALVGLALETTDPSPQDPMIRNTIQALLDRQIGSDFSWPGGGVLKTRLASTSLVMAYFPAALERLGGIDVDLHLVIPNTIELNNSTLIPTSVTDEANRKHYLWKIRGVTGKGRDLNFDLTALNLAPNENRPVAIAAYLEFENSFTAEKMRIPVDIPVIKARSGLTLTVDTDKAEYQANETVNISNLISNIENTQAIGEAYLIVRAKGSTTLLTTYLVINIDLAANATTTKPLTWNTKTHLRGPYEVEGKLYNRTGDLIETVITPFEIIAGDAVLSTQISTDKPTYPAWASVIISHRFINTAPNGTQPPGIAIVEIKDPNQQIIKTYTFNVPSIASNEQHQIDKEMLLDDALTGNYRATLNVNDAQTGEATSTSNTQFEVERGSAPGLTGTVRVRDAELSAEEPQQCTFTLINPSNQPISALAVAHTVVDIDNQLIPLNRDRTRDIPQNSQDFDTWNFATTALESGHYACVLQAKIDGLWDSLGVAPFTLIPSLDTEINTLQSGRLLVLIDANDNNDPHGPQNTPSTTEQRVFLETLLTEAGWSYTITENKGDFARELRTGDYTGTLLLSEQIHIDQQVQHELRESNYRGEGIVLGGGHDKRNNILDEALGIKFKGKPIKATGIALTEEKYGVTGPVDFVIDDNPINIELNGAQAVGTYQNKSKTDNNPSVTEHDYGQGKTVYIGHDVLLQATMDGQTGAFAELIRQSLVQIHPEKTPMAGTIIPIVIHLQSKSQSIEGQVLINIHTQQMIDPTEITYQDPNWVWPYQLDAESQKDLLLWIRTESDSILSTTMVIVQINRSGTTREHQREIIDIPLSERQGLDEALIQLNVLGNQKDGQVHYKTVRRHAEAGQQAYQQQDYDTALSELIKATDKLIGGSRPENQEIRWMLDKTIRQISREIY